MSAGSSMQQREGSLGDSWAVWKMTSDTAVREPSRAVYLLGDVVVGGSLGQSDHEITEFSVLDAVRKEVSKGGPGMLNIH